MVFEGGGFEIITNVFYEWFIKECVFNTSDSKIIYCCSKRYHIVTLINRIIN